MSRHGPTAFDPIHDIAVGWDGPMGTFFTQALDTAGAEEDGTYRVLWLGTRFHEVLKPATVIAAVAPFATVPNDLLRQLVRDRLTDRQ